MTWRRLRSLLYRGARGIGDGQAIAGSIADRSPRRAAMRWGVRKPVLRYGGAWLNRFTR